MKQRDILDLYIPTKLLHNLQGMYFLDYSNCAAEILLVIVADETCNFFLFYMFKRIYRYNGAWNTIVNVTNTERIT